MYAQSVVRRSAPEQINGFDVRLMAGGSSDTPSQNSAKPGTSPRSVNEMVVVRETGLGMTKKSGVRSLESGVNRRGRKYVTD